MSFYFSESFLCSEDSNLNHMLCYLIFQYVTIARQLEPCMTSSAETLIQSYYTATRVARSSGLGGSDVSVSGMATLYVVILIFTSLLTHLTRMRHLMAHRPSVEVRGCATSWLININYRFLKLYAPEVCGFVSEVSITSYLCSCWVSRM